MFGSRIGSGRFRELGGSPCYRNAVEQHDRSHISDELMQRLEAIRPLKDGLYAVGFGMWRLIHPDGSEETGRIVDDVEDSE